jgi:hypothetical protein
MAVVVVVMEVKAQLLIVALAIHQFMVALAVVLAGFLLEVKEQKATVVDLYMAGVAGALVEELIMHSKTMVALVD